MLSSWLQRQGLHAWHDQAQGSPVLSAFHTRAAQTCSHRDPTQLDSFARVEHNIHVAAARREPAMSSDTTSISPSRVLQRVEFLAITVAAACQAATLVLTAASNWRKAGYTAEVHDQPSCVGEVTPEATIVSTAGQGQWQQEQQHSMVLLQQAPPAPVLAPPAAVPAGLQLVMGSAVVVGLLCGACLRQLQARHWLQQPASGLKPSADAAVRLAALEVASQQTAAQLESAARQMDKLQARVRLATTDLKQPIRATQGAAAQQAAALLKLSEQQAVLQQQVDGTQELIAALQGLAAKQFKVSAEALQQLKQGQAQLSSKTSSALGELQKQQHTLQQQLQAAQQQLHHLQQQPTPLAQQRQQHEALSCTPALDSRRGTSSSSGSSTSNGPATAPPDPWRVNGAAVGHSISSQDSSNSSNGTEHLHPGSS